MTAPAPAPLARLTDPVLAAEALSLVLYGSKTGSRAQEFQEGFRDGIEACDNGQWVPALGSGPWATGYSLAEVYRTRR